MAGNEFEAMRAAKQNAKARLFAIPGVHAVGLGPKQVGGQTTAQPAIIVYVLEKKPPSNVPDEQLIPAEIDGYATDVIQSGMPSLAAAKADDVDEVNDNTSRPRPLMGGVQMVVALSESSGTLGFLGTLANGDVVAVTNWHVVAAGNGTKTNLKSDMTIAGRKFTVTFSKTDTNPIPVGSVVVYTSAKITGTPTGYDFYVQSVLNETLETIAQKLIDEINSLTGTGITATRTGAVIEIQDNTSAQEVGVRIYGPTRPDPNCELHVTATKNTVTLSGTVADDNYGILLAVNFTAPEHQTAGLFLRVTKGETPEAIAVRLAQAFKDLNPSSFTATVTGKKVSFSPATQIDVFAWRDIRAAQPSNNFATGCCDCCVDEIGATLRADYGLDAAIVRLNPKRVDKYLAEVMDIGYIVGPHEVTLAELPYPVKKRGARTGVRSGKIEAIDVDGIIAPGVHIPPPPGAPPGWKPPRSGPRYAPRKYDGAMKITSTVSATTLFSDQGDSGSAILHETAGGGWEVVGLLFGAFLPAPGDTTPPHTVATRIQPILDRFQLTVSKATALGQEQIVPQSQGARSTVGRPASEDLTPASEIWASVGALQQQLSASATGRAHLTTLTRNLREVNALINQNRRVGVAWQRNGGPIIVHRFLQAVRDPEQPMPAEIMDESWGERLSRIAAVMRAHASEELQRALNGATWDFIVGLGGKSSRDVQELLQRLDRAAPQPAHGAVPVTRAPSPSPPAAE
jgi:hypothetical protein